MSFEVKANGQTNDFPIVSHADRTYCLLNCGLEADIGGVTYRLTSAFSGKGDMGAVIDTIELERNHRQSA